MTAQFIEKVLWVEKGKGIAACGCIPTDAEFFKDHFPGFPVLPGVLALEMLRQTAELYHQTGVPSGTKVFKLKQVKSVKFSNYLKPGDAWESHLDLVSETGETSEWQGRLLYQGKTAVSARFILTPASQTKF